jgi:hypothetical protein
MPSEEIQPFHIIIFIFWNFPAFGLSNGVQSTKGKSIEVQASDGEMVRAFVCVDKLPVSAVPLVFPVWVIGSPVLPVGLLPLLRGRWAMLALWQKRQSARALKIQPNLLEINSIFLFSNENCYFKIARGGSIPTINTLASIPRQRQR